MLEKQSLCIHQLSEDLAEQKSYYRFVNNSKVREGNLVHQSLLSQSRPSLSTDLLVISDTSSISLEHQRYCLSGDKAVGLLGNKISLGYYLHGSLVLNTNYEVQGISDVLCYKRSKKVKVNCSQKHRNDKPLSEKESHRWRVGVSNSINYLGNPSRLTFIQDREGDIYELLEKIKESGSNYIIRSQHNRKIRFGGKSILKLKAYMSSCRFQGQYSIQVPIAKRGNKSRKAVVSVRYSPVILQAPTHYGYPVTMAGEHACYVVEVYERDAPKNTKAVHWLLYTNHPVVLLEQALQVIRHYQARWCIEDVFRGMKNKGLQVDNATLETGAALRKLGLMSFDISATALKLRQAREGIHHIPIEEVFDEQQQACLVELCLQLEGPTEKQANPHPSNSLTWAAWIIARLGGWKTYRSQRPPGIITMQRGIQRFGDIYFGWNIPKIPLMYKR